MWDGGRHEFVSQVGLGRLERSEAEAFSSLCFGLCRVYRSRYVPFWNCSLGSVEEKYAVCRMLWEGCGFRAKCGMGNSPSEITDHRRIPFMIPQRKVERKKRSISASAFISRHVKQKP